MTDHGLAPDIDPELLADLGVGIIVLDADGAVLGMNRPARALMRSTAGAITRESISGAPFEFVDEHDRPIGFEAFPVMRALRTGTSVVGATVGFRRIGEVGHRWLACGAHLVPQDDGTHHVVCSFVDVTEQRKALAAVHERDRRFRHLAENAADMIFRTRIQTDGIRFDYLNPAVEQVLGYPRADLYADFDFAIRLMHPDDREDVWDYFGRVTAGERMGEESVVVRLTRHDGDTVWLQIRAVPIQEGAEVVGLEGIARDVSDLKRREADLHHQAMHDALTGIPNRASFLVALDSALARARSTGAGVAVLYADLDRFKTVNDGLGHDAGDRVLAALAARLADVVRPSDTVGRIGGDEFAAVLSDLRDADEARVIAGRLLDAFGAPLVLDEGELVTTASIGVAFTADCVQTPAELLRRADVAMYEAKDRGRSRVECYEAPTSAVPGRGASATPG